MKESERRLIYQKHTIFRQFPQRLWINELHNKQNDAEFCLVKDFLSSKEVERLQTAHRTCNNKKHVDRVKTILYLNIGDSYEEIAKRLLLNDSTLRNYFSYYVQGGVETLLRDDKNLENKIYFLDGCHPLHNSVQTNGWIKKGKEKSLPANTGRARLNLNGAYNIEDHKVIVRDDETINSQSTLSLIQKIKLLQLIGKIYLIADNAKYYRSKIVTEFLKITHE